MTNEVIPLAVETVKYEISIKGIDMSDTTTLFQQLGEAIGAYGLNCAQTQILAPSVELVALLNQVRELPQQDKAAPQPDREEGP